MLFAESRKRRKRNADRALPERLDVSGVGCSRLLSTLLSFERRLDATIARRYVDVQEAVLQPIHHLQTMRLLVWHAWNAQATGWTLRVLGEWVDDVEGSVGVGSAVGGPLRVLGSLLSAFIVQLDPALYPGEDGLVEWHKHSTAACSDGFEVHRTLPPSTPLSAFPCQVKLFLYPDYSPPLFTLSTSLARLLSLRQATHVQVLRLLWLYVVQHSLLTSSAQAQPQATAAAVAAEQASAAVIAPDEQLSVVLGHSTPVTLAQLNACITQHHLLTPEPIILNYSIAPPSAPPAFHASSSSQPHPPLPSSTTAPPVSIFDISLPVPELPALATMGATLQSTFQSFVQQTGSQATAQTHNAQAAASPLTPAAVPGQSSSAASSPTPPTASAAAASSSASPTSASSPTAPPPPSVPPTLSKEWKELSSLSDAMSAHLAELHRIGRRRDLLHAFACCPVDTLHLLLTQQTRHVMNTLTTQRADQAEKRIRVEQTQSQLPVGSAAATSTAHLHLGSSRSVALTLGEEEKARRGRYYTADWMADAVDRYLAQQSNTHTRSA